MCFVISATREVANTQTCDNEAFTITNSNSQASAIQAVQSICNYLLRITTVITQFKAFGTVRIVALAVKI